MTLQEPAPPPAQTKSAETSFRDTLKSLIGKVVTVVTAESYEKAPVGHHLRPAFYKAKPSGLGSDYLVLMTEVKNVGSAKQLVPLASIKRLSITKGEIVLHL